MPFISYYAPTPVDRLGIYTSIIQLIFFSRIIVLIKHNNIKIIFIIVISLIYTGVNWVFLNHADNIRYWLPYKNILFYD